MKRNDSAQLNEAIWSMMPTKTTAEIKRILEADGAGLGRSIVLARRTLQRRQEKLREERGDPVQLVQEGEELSAAEDITRMFLTKARSQVKDAQTPEELAKCAKNVRLAEEIRRQRSQPASPSFQSRGGKAKARSITSDSVLDRLATEMGKQQAGDVHADTDTSNGQPEPASSHA